MLWRDLGFACRRLWKQPGVSLVALAALALGIGANTAIFSLLDAVVLKPLPYRHAERIVAVWASAPEQGLPQTEISFPKMRALGEQGRSFTALTSYVEEPMNLTERGDPLSLDGARITSGFFDVWGIEPILGRRFTAAEDKKGGADVVLLSAGLWRRRYAGDRAILGRALRIDGKSRVVVGVMPDVLRFPFSQVDLWVPRPNEISLLPEAAVEAGSGYLTAAARLAPGVSLATAKAEVERISQRYREQFPGHGDAPFGVRLVAMNEQLIGPLRAALLLLLGAVGFVLLIACADVGNLLLAQGLARRREIAIRIAIGASRGAIVRQLLAEGVVLALAGGALGLLLASWGLRLLVAAHPADVPRLAEVGIDGRVLVFTLAVALAAGLLFSLAPALQTVRQDAKPALAAGGRGGTGGAGGAGGGRSRTQAAFVVAEVALALVLLIGAGLFVQRLRALAGVDLGFEPQNLLVLQVSLPTSKYADAQAQRVFFEQALDRVRHLPGVTSAGTADYLPILGTVHVALAIEGKPLPAVDKLPLVWRLMVAPGTFRAFAARLVKGRDFADSDAPDGPLHAVINNALARQYFGAESPLGKHILMGRNHRAAEVIGVVDDMQELGLDSPKEPEIFLSTHQSRAELAPATAMQLLVRTPLPPIVAAREVRQAVLALDPEQPVSDLQTMDGIVAASLASRKLTTALLSGFSLAALLLCLLGIYGVVAHAVSLRTKEIGVRMALGASSVEILRAVTAQGLGWVVIGLGLGLGAAVVLSRLMASQLLDASAIDPLYFVAAPLVLGLVALLASYVPARRAARIEPAITLRTD